MEYVTTNEVGGHVHNSLLILKIHEAFSAHKMSHPMKRDTSTFPTNMWYDE